MSFVPNVPVLSTTRAISTYIVFSPNKTVACVDLSNYTDILTVIVKPKPDPNVKPPVPGTDTAMIIIPSTTPTPPPSNGKHFIISIIMNTYTPLAVLLQLILLFYYTVAVFIKAVLRVQQRHYNILIGHNLWL